MNLNNSGGVVFRQLMGGGEAFSLLSDAHSALINLWRENYEITMHYYRGYVCLGWNIINY